jgi:hypothetical protein
MDEEPSPLKTYFDVEPAAGFDMTNAHPENMLTSVIPGALIIEGLGEHPVMVMTGTLVPE